MKANRFYVIKNKRVGCCWFFTFSSSPSSTSSGIPTNSTSHYKYSSTFLSLHVNQISLTWSFAKQSSFPFFEMASSSLLLLQLILVVSVSLFHFSQAGRKLVDEGDSLMMKYHNGALLSGKISVNLIWYGNFKPSQKAIVSDFLYSLHSSKLQTPSVSTWWKNIQKFYHQSKKSSSLVLTMGKHVLDENCSLGKSLAIKQIVALAAKGEPKNAINVVLTASDVAVEGFCSSRCGTHGSSSSSSSNAHVHSKNYKFAYIWVGNSETQCPGQCAWPYHQPIYGPQSAPLVAPNNDVGMDGLIINLAGLLAGTATNPFGNGYFQGPSDLPLEAASACSGVYGKGAYPGYAGDLLMEPTTGASYNANGANGRKYLLPALFDPSTSSCSTLV